MSLDAPNTTEDLLAKEDIRDVLARYARGIDRADGELLKSCYHADAQEEHGSTYAGPAHPYIDGAVARMKKNPHPMAHYICNTHVERDGDTAFVETYVLTFARFEKDGEPYDTLTGGRLFDKFEKRDGKWKIAHRKMTFDWNRDAPSAEGWCLGVFDPEDPKMNMWGRDGKDLTYTRF